MQVPAAPAAPLTVVTGDAVPEGLRLRLVEAINADRGAAGVKPVSYSSELSRAGDAHCAEMLREGYMSHWNLAGWKPYVRYSQAGIRDSTSENLWSIRQPNFGSSAEEVWAGIHEGHRRFMAEQPPNDGHRKSILDPRHQTVGIGIAHGPAGLRMMELFAARAAELESLPARARLRDDLAVRGIVRGAGLSLFAIVIYYEPLPIPPSKLALQTSGAYGLPSEEWVERPLLGDTLYSDGTQGTVLVSANGRFVAPLRFWKNKPGIYTVTVWVREGRGKAFIGAMTSILVEE